MADHTTGPQRAAHGHLEHLTDEDLRLLATSAGPGERRDAGWLRRDPEAVLDLLASDRAYAAVFAIRDDTITLPVSPFLTFALVVHRTARDAQTATFVDEWVGPRRRVPVFAGDELREFLADPLRRLFLAELLASYTHVASGSFWVETRRGWRRRRFSELDPVRLAELLDVLPESERAGVYRRLGDLALFLTGVFPDHTAADGFSSIGEARLRRAGRLRGDVGDENALHLLEELGQRCYRMAGATSAAPEAWTLRLLGDVADRFRQARRTLNVVTDRHLFPTRAHWFGRPAG